VGADGVVFMVDSQEELLDENLASWNELMSMISEQDRFLPIVVCLNKQDLERAVQEDQVRTYLSLPSSVPVFRSIAKDGFNVMEAFQYLFENALRSAVLTKPAT
jgi:signal recognition particle receptor subunit beta